MSSSSTAPTPAVGIEVAPPAPAVAAAPVAAAAPAVPVAALATAPSSGAEEDDDSKRRPRLAFRDEEVAFLKEGVEKFGESPQRWIKILSEYAFNPRRTSGDLKDKWRNIVRLEPIRKDGVTPQKKVTWGEEEIKTLRAGYKELGTSKNPWATILSTYKEKFHPVRTSVHLKDKWRNLSKSNKSTDAPRTAPVKKMWDAGEVENLKKGVAEFHSSLQRWSKILQSYKFKPGRSSVDLKDKWRNLVRKDPLKQQEIAMYGHKKVAWTETEVEALKRGREKHSGGKNMWATILSEYKSEFNKVRTSVHLKDKWRHLSQTGKVPPHIADAGRKRKAPVADAKTEAAKTDVKRTKVGPNKGGKKVVPAEEEKVTDKEEEKAPAKEEKAVEEKPAAEAKVDAGKEKEKPAPETLKEEKKNDAAEASKDEKKSDTEDTNEPTTRSSRRVRDSKQKVRSQPI